MPLVECVPNVSEGRRTDVIAEFVAAVDVPDVKLLDCSSDASHNRTVLSLAGEPAPLQAAIVALFGSAIARIDLRTHDGVHPRIGAVDVVPFVPLSGSRMEDCAALARSTAAIVSSKYLVPVYLYEEAASTPDRRNLAHIRRGGFEGLSEKMAQPHWTPDFGEAKPHATAGVSAIGARPILIAYNINLDTSRLDVAKRIARTIRASSGGLSHVKAMGVPLAELGVTQVSMNLTDYRRTSMSTVFDAVEREAAIDGVRLLESEIVGLVPAEALPADPVTRLKLRPSDADRILEKRLGNLALKHWGH